MNQIISNAPMRPTDAVERPMTLIEKLKHEHDDRELTCQDLFEDGHFDDKKTELLIQQTGVMAGLQIAIDMVKQHSDWIDISVEPNNRTEFDSEAVLAIDANGYTYNVTLANVVIRGETKREWTECKAKWNGEFWEAVEYICQAEKLVAYKYIPKPPSEVQDD